MFVQYVFTYVCVHSTVFHLPVAVTSLRVARIVRQHGDGLLRVSTGVTGPSFSFTVYIDWLNLTVIATISYTWQTDKSLYIVHTHWTYVYTWEAVTKCNYAHVHSYICSYILNYFMNFLLIWNFHCKFSH